MNDPTEVQVAGPRGNPWERRSELGALNGLVEAIKQFALSPTEAFEQTIKRGDYGSPLLFAVVVGWLGTLVYSVWQLIFGASVISMFPAELRDSVGFLTTGTGGLLATLIFAPIMIVIALFIWSAILHLCLVIVGGLDQSTSGFEGSLRVVSYTTVAQLGNLVPFFGGLICLVWSVVLAIIGIQKLHGASQGKAIAAVLIPLLLCCVCIVLLVVSLGAGLATFFATQS